MAQEYLFIYESLTGGCVFLHPSHFKDEIMDNLIYARTLADKGYTVYLLPYINEQGIKNPDALINGKIVDFKCPKYSTKLNTAIQNAIKTASKQGVDIVTVFLDNPNLTNRDIKRALIASFQKGWNTSIEEIWLIFSDFNLVQINREEVENLTFFSKLP
jgi:Contact-dependent growth inhibition CdiA C-terminal domain